MIDQYPIKKHRIPGKYYPLALFPANDYSSFIDNQNHEKKMIDSKYNV